MILIPHLKKDATCDVTKQTSKMMRKENTNGSHVILCSLIYKNKRHDFIINTLNSNFLMGRFYFS